MRKSDFSSVSRRSFLSATAAAGAVSLVIPTQSEAQSLAAKFSGLKPLRPAPVAAENHAPVTPPPLAAHVLNKAAFGPRPGDVDSFNALPGDDAAKLASWVETQLNPTGTDTEVDDRLIDLLLSSDQHDVAAFDTIGLPAQDLWEQYARSDTYAVNNRPVWQMERLTLLRGMYSQWQLREVMFDFWFNHFNVYGREFPTRSMMPEFDRVIRPHIFGNFGELLNAVAKTASMLYYLDNYANTWPNPNENYAREVLELHTLGAIENYYGAVEPGSLDDNIHNQRTGYTEIDVFQFARALTGWSVANGGNELPDTGAFIFNPDRHYNFSDGPIEVMDISISETGGESDVTNILNYLAGHYGTARHVAWKLCTRLIGDNPHPDIVESTANEFYNRRADGDQLKEVYRHVLLSDEFRNTWGAKTKRPVETLIRSMRAADVDLTFRIDDTVSNGIFGRLDDTGQFPFGYEAPTGYPDEKEMWLGSGPLIMSWRSVTYMLRQDSIVNLAAQTNIGIPEPADRTPANIVEFWMNRALGYSLDPVVGNRMVQFITDILSGLPTDPINTVTSNIGESTYQRIIRAVVGLVLMSPDAMRR
jgi:uncharacterized protein (DUF1800 family)